MISISVCMIVKNEEKILARCLDSIGNIADEIIIVDTGSTDSTVDIAKKYTDKVYTFKFDGNFSDARNYAFSKATKDYIYSADADEIIDSENHNRFLMLKQVLDNEVDIVQMYYKNQLEYNTTYNYDCELRPKLYKRLRTFTWIEPIHEMVKLEPIIFDSDISIIHKPQTLHSKRDFACFLKACQNQRLSDRLTIMYAKELFISGDDNDIVNAYPYFSSLLSEVLEDNVLKAVTCVLTRYAYINNDYPLLLKSTLKNMADGNGSSEVCYYIGEYFYHLKDYDEAYMWYYNSAYETDCELNIQYREIHSVNRLEDIKKKRTDCN